jgi:hypothetical protein
VSTEAADARDNGPKNPAAITIPIVQAKPLVAIGSPSSPTEAGKPIEKGTAEVDD